MNFLLKESVFRVKSSRSNISLKLPSLLLICGAIIKITLGSEVSLVHLRAHEPHSLPNLRVGSFGGQIPGVVFQSCMQPPFPLRASEHPSRNQYISFLRSLDFTQNPEVFTQKSSHATPQGQHGFSITVNYENDLTWSEVNSEDSSYQPSFTWHKSLSLNLLTNSFPFWLMLYSLKCWRISSSGFFQQPINSLSLYFKRLLFGLCTPHETHETLLWQGNGTTTMVDLLSLNPCRKSPQTIQPKWCFNMVEPTNSSLVCQWKQVLF